MTVTATDLLIKSMGKEVHSGLKIEFIESSIHFSASGNITLTFTSLTDANSFGFLERIVKGRTHIFGLPLAADARPIGKVKVSFENPVSVTYYLDEDRLFETSEKMFAYLLPKFPLAFSNMSVNTNGLISFETPTTISRIVFDDNLTRVFGFDQSDFSLTGTGKYMPQLKNIPNQLYIYCSLVDPIQVDKVKVPLLKNITIDRNKTSGEMIYVEFNNLMYVPLLSSSMNNIEMNIRDDSGRLIDFSEDSKLTVTIHVRRRG